jgi:hypothetical protein
MSGQIRNAGATWFPPGVYACPAPCRGAVLPRLTDPHQQNRLIGWMSRAVWLILAWSFGILVGRLIALAIT